MQARGLTLVLGLAAALSGCAVGVGPDPAPLAAPLVGGGHHGLSLAPGSGPASAAPYSWHHEVRHAGASYIALHFTAFDLGPAGVLTVSDPTGGQAYELRGRGKLQAGTFWAQHVKGEALVLDLVAPGTLGRPFFVADEYVAGAAPAPTDAICGPDDKRAAPCYRESHPTEYARGRAVARLLSAGSGICTGWLVGADDLLVTNNHCISGPQKALDTDYEFMDEVTECGATTLAPSRIFSGGELVMTDENLDVTLIRVAGHPAREFGYLEIDDRPAALGEEIYVIGHPAGRPKEFTIASSEPLDQGGIPRVQSVWEEPCFATGYHDVGYWADTEGGQSGAPVLARSSHRVIALHHCAGCLNRGVPIDLVYDRIKDLLVTSRGALRLDASAYGCGGAVGLLLQDRDLPGSGAPTVTLTTSAGDVEVATLTVEAAGVFRGLVSLGEGSAVAHDGVLAVAEGVTVEARYEDADVGDGTAAVVTVAAAVDCRPPLLDGVAVVPRARAATVLALTDEAAWLHVRYGADCAALTGVANGRPATTHAVALFGLTPETTFAYVVEAADAAGNLTLAEPACATFTTTAAPTVFFTEEFTGFIDLRNTALTLTPDGSGDFYAACRQAIAALPTDPTAAPPLVLGDDDAVEVRPSRPVPVFGRPLATFWIGSNGYLTARRQTTPSATQRTHFGEVRVAPLFHDLDPSQGGTVSFREVANRVVVTWRDVPAHGGGSSPSTFQAELYFDGRLRLSWLTVGAWGGIVGVSDGLGLPEGYVATDLSALGPCAPAP